MSNTMKRVEIEGCQLTTWGNNYSTTLADGTFCLSVKGRHILFEAIYQGAGVTERRYVPIAALVEFLKVTKLEQPTIDMPELGEFHD